MDKPDKYGITYEEMGNSASCTDCTGLIPVSPVEEEDMLSYEEVYRYLPPTVEIKDKPPADMH